MLGSNGMQPQLQPVSAPLGFISDVHGNLPALDAVLAELQEKGVEQVYVAGDILFGGDQPLEVWRRLQGIDAICIKGLSDAALCSVDPETLKPITAEESVRAEQFRQTRAALGDLVIEQLRRLPERARIPMIDGREALMVHGSPADATRIPNAPPTTSFSPVQSALAGVPGGPSPEEDPR